MNREGCPPVGEQPGGEQPPAIPATRAAMLRFRQMKTLLKFASVHAHDHLHFNFERHLINRQTYRESHSAALAEWQGLAS